MTEEFDETYNLEGYPTEAMVYHYLTTHHPEMKIEWLKDFKKDKKKQKSEIDMIITNRNKGTVINVEVKKDWKISQTGNIFLEEEHKRNKKDVPEPGWGKKISSEYLIMYDGEDTLYIIWIYYLIFIMWKEIKKYPEMKITFWNKKDKCITTGLLIPIDWLMKKYPHAIDCWTGKNQIYTLSDEDKQVYKDVRNKAIKSKGVKS